MLETFLNCLWVLPIVILFEFLQAKKQRRKENEMWNNIEKSLKHNK